jgi:hypothetical protein
MQTIECSPGYAQKRFDINDPIDTEVCKSGCPDGVDRVKVFPLPWGKRTESKIPPKAGVRGKSIS